MRNNECSGWRIAAASLLLGSATAHGKGPGVGVLGEQLRTNSVAIVAPCAERSAGSGCARGSLDRTFGKLRTLPRSGQTVRILHLGDSHVVSDYITGTVRSHLQARFGDAGRGFTQIDQEKSAGGRRLVRRDGEWVLDRIVDKGREGLAFGFSGVSIESTRKGAEVTYSLAPGDRLVRLYYQRQPGGGAADLVVGGKSIGSLTTGGALRSEVSAFDLPARDATATALRIVAGAPKVRLYGISFETKSPGVLYDVIGPLGGDAKVYLDLERASFIEHLGAYDPDLIVLMVGGNDAMKIRRGWRTLDEVRQHHVDLVKLLRSTVPDADCMIWSPMDAGDRRAGKITSRAMLKEVRAMQSQLATELGCAYWDMYGAMGGEGSIARWFDAGVINDDLVHPKGPAAELLGSLFSESFFGAVSGTRGSSMPARLN